MATKVIILEEEKKQTKKKPIVFVKMLRSRSLNVEVYHSEPHEWKYIELICKDYGEDGWDLMYAFDDDRKSGTLYIGYFNDGIV